METNNRRGQEMVMRTATSAGAIIITISCPLRSEEHTSELQSHLNLVCRLLLEKKKKLESFTPDMPDVSRILFPAHTKTYIPKTVRLEIQVLENTTHSTISSLARMRSLLSSLSF